MANRLLNYEPEFYARTALMWLRNRKGMLPRVYRTFQDERLEFGAGQVIRIRKPATFVAQSAPNSAAQDIKTGTMEVNLDIYDEVKIGASDIETARTTDRLINDHIGPMADALAEKFEERLLGLAAHVPHTYDFANDTNVGKKFAAMRRIMVQNKVPKGARIEYMASPLTIERSIGSTEFSQNQGAGDQGVNTQTTGELGPKYGFHFFESTMSPTFEGDAILSITGTKTVSGTPLKNATTISLNTSAAQTETLHKGAVIAITDTTTGRTERYTLTADAAASGNNWPNVAISPRLRRDLGASSTWNVVSTVGVVGSVPTYEADLAFHRNAFAAVTVPLPMYDDGGIKMYVASDPDTGLSVRARRFADGHTATRYVVLDMWGGIAALDPDLALRVCSH